jgi:hypothetical protein
VAPSPNLHSSRIGGGVREGFAAVDSGTLETVLREPRREKSPVVGMSLPLFVVAVLTGLVFCLYLILG